MNEHSVPAQPGAASAPAQPGAASALTSWRKMLDDRQRKVIAFAETYVRDFNHGTVGHNDLVLGPKGTPPPRRESG